jgi:hypothetical protein
MVNATVDNEAVSISLGKNESTTVPSGEVWKITITAGLADSFETSGAITINGSAIMFLDNFDGDDQVSYAETDTVVTGGDTISTDTFDVPGIEAHIGGFVVN